MRLSTYRITFAHGEALELLAATPTQAFILAMAARIKMAQNWCDVLEVWDLDLNIKYQTFTYPLVAA